MKKSILYFLCLTALLLSFSAAAAGPEQVNLTFLDKWGYKGVDGWGLYPRNGEFSWFGFILNNPTENEYTVTLPIDVDVAHQTMHPVANTFYRVLTPGSNYYPGDDLVNHYFTGSFKLPPNSTYSIFMDILEFQKYSSQWDTNIFFSVDISDAENKNTIDIKNGILAYDAYETLPKSREIVIAPAPVFTTIKFCRDYDPATGKISIAYDIRNNSTNSIPIELPKSVSVNGQDKTLILTTKSCFNKADPCEFTDGFYTLPAKRTVKVTAEADPAGLTIQDGFSVSTSFRYQYGERLIKGFSIGTAKDSCSAEPTAEPKPTENPTVTPESTMPSVTPEPVSAPLTNAGFCKIWYPDQKIVKFSFALKNNTNAAIPVEVPTSIYADGLQETVRIRYLSCTLNGDACPTLISQGIYTLKAGDTVKFVCESKLPDSFSRESFNIYTSLRYDYNEQRLIPFAVDTTTGSCPNPVTPIVPSTPVVTLTPDKPATPEVTVTPVPTETAALASVSFCRTFESGSKIVTFSYAIQNRTSGIIPVELASSILAEGEQNTSAIRNMTCSNKDGSCTSRISNGFIDLAPNEIITISGEAALASIPAKTDFYIRTSLRYRYANTMVPLLIGYTSTACSGSPVTPVIPTVSLNTPLTKVDFCKIQNNDPQNSAFAYTLRNDGTEPVSIELATTMAVQGMQQVLPIKYTGCTTNSSSCMEQITNGYLTLEAGNTAKLTGEIALSSADYSNLWIRTSLRYVHNSETLIPLALGQAVNFCSDVQQDQTSDNPAEANISKSGSEQISEDSTGIELYYIGESRSTTDIPSFPVK